jgi:hypothetical protein
MSRRALVYGTLFSLLFWVPLALLIWALAR